MKRFIITSLFSLFLAINAYPVSVSDVVGVFKGSLSVADTQTTNKEVYILPGVKANTVTIVIPSFAHNGAWGDLVLANLPMDANGSLSVNSDLYISARSERAAITGSSTLAANSAQLSLNITTPTLSGIAVSLTGSRVADNYALNNGGFEGSWSNSEPTGWHGFNTVTGSYASFASNNTQLSQSTEKRPGSTGSHSALIQSRIVLGNKANGNCTNGRINAGSTTATDGSGNYNFSDPSNTGYNTPFVGQPDSMVFWAKYEPGGGNVTDASNQARMHAVITTNARYQDPEVADYSAVKVADAVINYSATSDKGWQRLSVPFTYLLDPAKAAYIMITFSSNKTPAGGNSTKKSPDKVYLDDAEVIYNHALTSLTMNGNAISFVNGQATSGSEFSDSEYTFTATTNGKGAKTFIGYDATTNQALTYVVANNYAQTKAYSVYTLQMAEPVPPIVDTEYAYSATTCAGEAYSDELFSNLTEAGEYTTTIPNTQGGDSLITLTLSVLPTYSFAEEATINMDEPYTWRGRDLSHYTPGVYHETDLLQTAAGCDSLYTLTLTVKPIPYFFAEATTACQREVTSWHGQALPTAEPGTFVLYDSLQSMYATDSVYQLKLTVLPAWESTETKYVNEADLVWHGQTIQGLPTTTVPYFFYDSLKAANGCDSVYILQLYVSDIPVTYGSYEEVICAGEEVLFEGEIYTAAFDGEVRVAEPNIYGGDSLVHLLITVLPSYTIDEYMTITVGDDQYWEGWNLSTMPVGQLTLEASYYTVNDCDSTLVLHLTVQSQAISTDIETPQSNRRVARKVLYNGQLFIIREDETKYTVLGTKIQ